VTLEALVALDDIVASAGVTRYHWTLRRFDIRDPVPLHLGITTSVALQLSNGGLKKGELHFPVRTSHTRKERDHCRCSSRQAALSSSSLRVFLGRRCGAGLGCCSWQSRRESSPECSSSRVHRLFARAGSEHRAADGDERCAEAALRPALRRGHGALHAPLRVSWGSTLRRAALHAAG